MEGFVPSPPAQNYKYARMFIKGLTRQTRRINQGDRPRISAARKATTSVSESPLIPTRNSVVEPDTPCSSEGRKPWIPRALSGWRGGILVCIIITGFVLVINLAFLVWAVLKVDIKDGLGVAYRGDSDTMDQLSRSIHLVVNVL